MEIRKDFIDEINGLIGQKKSSKNLELEGKYRGNLSCEDFRNILSVLRGQYKEEIQPDTLDIFVKYLDKNYRISLIGKDVITKYCKTNMIDNAHDNIEVINKRRIRAIEFPDINFNIKLSEENEEIDFQLDLVHSLDKGYRFKKRFSYINGDVRYDLTLVKTSTAFEHKNFATSGCLGNNDTYELECEILKSTITALDFSKHLVYLYGIISKEQYIIPESQKKSILRNYIELTQKKVPDRIDPTKCFVGPQPSTLELTNLVPPGLGVITIWEDYTVTDKADGFHCNLYVDKTGDVYIINNRLNITYTGIKLTGLKSCIYDGELINNNIFAIFDTYYHKSEPIAKLTLPERIKVAEQFVKIVKKSINNKSTLKDIRVKEFYYGKDFAQDISKLLMKKFDYETDGLIFTPKSLPVGGLFKEDEFNLFGSWPRVFKWKPVEYNTIDFLARYKLGENGIQSTFIKQETHEIYRTIELRVGYNPIKWTSITPIDYIKNQIQRKYTYIDKLFLPADVESNFSEYSGVLVNGNLLCENGDIIKDKSIVECRYENGWHPIKVRKDKTEMYELNGLSRTANDYKSALNIWNTISNPVTHDHITGKIILGSDTKFADSELYYYREISRNKMASRQMLNFHNYVKSQLFSKMSILGCKTLFDVSCGKGGDLYKWHEAGFNRVLGVDYARDNIENPIDGIYARLLDNRVIDPHKVNYMFLTMDSSKKFTKEYVTGLKDEATNIVFGYQKTINPKFYNLVEKQYDIVSCQFSLHYFFQSEEVLDNFLYNVNTNLRPGGYFIGTCLNGFDVKSKLDIQDHIYGKYEDRTLWDIKKGYNNTSGDITYGEEIKVYMESIGRISSEYLVSIDILCKKLSKLGIRPLTKPDKTTLKIPETFGSFKIFHTDTATYPMTKEEIEYSYMNMWFIFKKKEIKAN